MGAQAAEAWECRQARKNGKIIINGRTLEGKIGATTSHSMYLASGLDDKSRCEVGIVTLPDGKALDGQAAQGLYEITLREEYVRLNDLTGSLTLTSGVQAAAGDKSIVDSLEGTVVWEYDPRACPQTIIRLYRGMMKAYINQSNTYEGSTVVVEHQDKDQAVRLEIAESFILCGHQAFRTHIKNIAVFIHKDDRMEVAQGRFNDKEGEGDLTRLESGMSFMQVRASMSMKEKLRQVRGAICVNRREIAHTRLDAIAGANNPYSLITIRERTLGDQGWWGSVCDKVLAGIGDPAVAQELHGGDPCDGQRDGCICGPNQLRHQERRISHTLQNVAPPRYKVGGKLYCSYPELKECHDPEMLPVDEVRTDPVKVNDIGLGKSIYTKEQLEEFAWF